MRQQEFINALRDSFPVNDMACAVTLANAMHVAQVEGSAPFTWGDASYVITCTWYDGCISGDCNPATCYSSWDLTTAKASK